MNVKMLLSKAGKLLLVPMFGALVLCGGATVRADGKASLTITDEFAPHGPRIRFEQFSTDLSASVSNAPKDTTEATISGPTWNWNTSKLSLTSINSDHTTLTSGFPPSYSDDKKGGDYSITVSCTATYTSTDKKTRGTTSIPVPGSKEVKFFIRVPEKVVFISADTPHAFRGATVVWPDGVSRDNTHGSTVNHTMQLRDNQNNPYGFGLPREDITGDIRLIQPGGGDTWGLNYNSGEGSPLANFTDALHFYAVPEPDYHPADDPLEGTLTQVWHCMELKPPYSGLPLYVEPGIFTTRNHPQGGDFLSNVDDKTLNTHRLEIHLYHISRN